MKMSKLIASTIAIVMAFNIGLAQDFFSDGESDGAEEQGFFQPSSEESYPSTPGERASRSDSDVPSNPGESAPIDDWLFLLPLLGIAVGGYFLMKRQREDVV